MAFDGITTRNVITELNNMLIGGRIEKIYVPTKNDIFLCFHTKDRESVKLLISIDANNARLHITNHSKENPVKAPQICMILRKHLQGAKLISITQYGMDRIITFNFETINDFGDLTTKKLIVELMGKYSNVILTDNEDKIIDAMRHVDFTMSSVREVLTNKLYVLPSTLGKMNFLETLFEEFKKILTDKLKETDLTSAISNTFIGFSKSFINSFLSDLDIVDINENSFKNIYEKLRLIFDTLKYNTIDFKLISDGKDYTLNLTSICSAMKKTTTENKSAPEDYCGKNLSTFLDDFYYKKETNSLIKSAKLNIEHEIKSNINKLNKKLTNVNEILKDGDNLEKYKQYGELLNCNMHLLKIGLSEIEVENFYDNNNLVKIPLQKNITPSRNAQNYFKKYNKLKNSILHATAYKKEYENDISYLSSVLFELESANSLFDVDEIRNELVNSGYLKKPYKSNKKTNDLPSSPIEYEYNGYKILVGRNNIQNDKLTFKIAKKSYTWLHTKKIHGSHVIITADTFPDDVLLYAAKLAVEHSQGKNSSKVEVDYTKVKYVHKESGAKPGMVVYTDYHTILV